MTYVIPTPEDLQRELEPVLASKINELVGRCVSVLKTASVHGVPAQCTISDPAESHIVPYVQKRFAERGWIVKKQSNEEETWLEIKAAKKTDGEPFKTAMRDDAERLSS